MKSKVGILTWHDPTNCGSALQAYAMHRYLLDLGYDATIIRYVPWWCRGDYMQMPYSTLSRKRKVKRFVKDALLPFYDYLPNKLKTSINPFFSFYNTCCKMTPACTEESIVACCRSFTTIISGSDQIWNPDHVDLVFLQNFVDGATNQISYAASLGDKGIPVEYEEDYKKYLSKYSAISVREHRGKSILEEIGIDSDVHIDPTMLLDATSYKTIEKPVENVHKPFVFCYFLRTDREYKSYIQEYLKLHNLQAIGFSFDKNDYEWMKEVRQMGPQEWLWLIDNAELVLTNSYHATILSLVLNTPFYNFVRFAYNDPNSQNARLTQLNSYFDISDYLIEGEIPEKSPYPFERFRERIPALQQKAKDYLKANIK